MGYARILWQTRVTAANITGTDTATGYPDDNVSDWRTYETWRGDGTTNSYTLTVAYGSDISSQSLAIVGHNLNTVGARYKLDASTAAAPSVWDALVAYSTPGDNYCKAHFYTQANYANYRLTIDNNVGANFAPEIGIFFVGNYLEFPVLIDYPFDESHKKVEMDSVLGNDGRLLGRSERYVKRLLNPTFQYMQDSFHTTYNAFWDAHRSYPFVWVWDYENYPADAFLVQFTEPEKMFPWSPPLRGPLTLIMEGVAEE